MTRKLLLSATCLLAALALAGARATPPVFETPAPIAFMVDLSSGAMLFASDADRRIPPASMAKMMTTHVAFAMIARGELELEPDVHRPARDLAAMARARGRIDDVPFARRAGQRPQSAARHRHAVGQRRDRRAGRMHFGDGSAFVALMNRKSQELGLSQFQLGQSGRLAGRRRDLHHGARSRPARGRDDRRYPQLYREYYGLREFTWGRTMGSNQEITQANRNPCSAACRARTG